MTIRRFVSRRGHPNLIVTDNALNLTHNLTLSVFQTVVAEAEAILNSRALTHVGRSISDERPLTPNHFLLRRPQMCLKHLVYSNQWFSDKYFKLTQTLFDHYWSRLLKEYVP